MKIELKHIVTYLPYGLKVFTEDKEFEDGNPIYTVTGISKYEDDSILWEYNNGYHLKKHTIKPILRPMEDLIKPLENGDIPAILLAERAIELGLYKDIAPTIEFDYKIVNKPFSKALKVTKLDDWVVYLSFKEPFRCKYYVIEKLFEWHFDVFGLIDKQLAIDINTINQKTSQTKTTNQNPIWG